MCGIFASYNVHPDVNYVRKLLSNRGPDGFNFQDVGSVRMCHSRLSITGEKGTQPFHVNNNDRHFLYAVNGEFYDYKSIKKSFSYPYETDTDSEIISPVYLNHGLGAEILSKLNGEFSFVLYDVNEHAFYLVRDRFGVKPLFYSIVGNRVLIASETKMLLPFINAEFNTDVLKTMLTVQYHNNQSALFSNISQVPPGSMVKIDLKTLSLETHSYFDYAQEKESNQVSKENVLDALQTSVSRRTDTNLPIAYTVSGGIDSASILSLGNKPNGSKAFTVSFQGSGEFDELAWAEKAASFAGIGLDPLLVDERSLIDNMEAAITASESLSINSHVAAKYMMFEKIKSQGFRVSLSGEGADEIFLGYSHFLMDKNLNLDEFGNMQGMHLPHGDILSDAFLKPLLSKIPSFLQAKLSMGAKMHPLLNVGFKDGYENSVLSQWEPIVSKQSSPVKSSASLWVKSCFANYILNALSDRLEMHHSIEGRVPFLDNDLVRLGLSISEEQKLGSGGTKQILREAVRGIVPDEIYQKQKHPFVSPSLIMWSEDSVFFNFFMDIISSQDFKEMAIFSPTEIVALIKKMKKGSVDKQGYDNVFMLILSVYFLHKNLIKGLKNE